MLKLKNDSLQVVNDAPTGFMLINRSTFDAIKIAYPNIEYVNDIKSYEKYTTRNMLWNFFPVGINNNTYMSEDYGFCALIKALGYKIHIDLSINLIHIGQFHYYGNPLQNNIH